MGKVTRKRHTAEFKARVALDAIKGEQTLTGGKCYQLQVVYVPIVVQLVCNRSGCDARRLAALISCCRMFISSIIPAAACRCAISCRCSALRLASNC